MNAARILSFPGPDEPAAGRIWVHDEPDVLGMSGEIDLVTVGSFAASQGAPEPTAAALAPMLCAVTEVDMREVTFADSSAVGLIAALVVLCDRDGRRLTLCGVPPLVRTTLEIAGVLSQVDLQP